MVQNRLEDGVRDAAPATAGREEGGGHQSHQQSRLAGRELQKRWVGFPPWGVFCDPKGWSGVLTSAASCRPAMDGGGTSAVSHRLEEAGKRQLAGHLEVVRSNPHANAGDLRPAASSSSEAQRVEMILVMRLWKGCGP